MIGAYIGAAVGFLLIVIVDPLKALLFILFIVVLQQLEGNIIYPKVVGNSIGLPGIWVLAAITVGGGLMGITGVLLGVRLLQPFTSCWGKRLMPDSIKTLRLPMRVCRFVILTVGRLVLRRWVNDSEGCRSNVLKCMLR
jgi:hypothetical protein